MLAYLENEDETCPSCGLPKEECQAKEAQFGFEGYPIRCHVTQAREIARDQFAASKGADTRGLMFGVRRR